MYQFHYQFMLPKYASTHLKLLFTYTDSLCNQVFTDDFYRDIQPDLEKFDTADYPEQHVLHSPMNKEVIGKFKDETSSCPIREIRHVDYKDCLFTKTLQSHSMMQIIGA